MLINLFYSIIIIIGKRIIMIFYYLKQQMFMLIMTMCKNKAILAIAILIIMTAKQPFSHNNKSIEIYNVQWLTGSTEITLKNVKDSYAMPLIKIKLRD